jgi:hypothetical protein
VPLIAPALSIDASADPNELSADGRTTTVGARAAALRSNGDRDPRSDGPNEPLGIEPDKISMPAPAPPTTCRRQ